MLMAVACLGTLALAAESGEAQDAEDTAAASPGAALFTERCASCHLAGDTAGAPGLPALQQMHPLQIQFAMNRGSMRPYAEGLDRGQRRQLADWLAGDASIAGYEPTAADYCDASKSSAAGDLEPVWNGRWGVDLRQTRHQPDSALNADNVAELSLAWAFAVPGAATMRSQPVVAGDTLYLATTAGQVFALDRRSGCVRWMQDADAPVRTALHLGQNPDTGDPVLYVGDTAARVLALDARDGSVLWERTLRLYPWSMLTGSPVQHDTQLFVPVSSFEVSLARRDDHPCCRARGAVVALHAATGEVQWQTFMGPEAQRTGYNPVGAPAWGPSGASVWSTPTVDPDRNRLYVGTGQNNSAPATELSDAIVALTMDTGELAWSFQGTKGDTYNDSCTMRPRGANCPEDEGPDFDFGASVIRAQLENGREILLAGQKSGEVYALDPGQDGRLIWRTRLSQGTWLGGIHWGMSLQDGTLYVPVNDPDYRMPGYEAQPGLYALDIRDGSQKWAHRIERGCDLGGDGGRATGTPWPACSYFYGYSAAAAGAPGVIFAAGTDGQVRAHAAADGAVLWQAATARPFDTVNQVSGHGGAIDKGGVVVADRMIYVQSGYSLFNQMPGNVLLAFALPEAAAEQEPTEIEE